LLGGDIRINIDKFFEFAGKKIGLEFNLQVGFFTGFNGTLSKRRCGARS
jgi:hypothetical protein